MQSMSKEICVCSFVRSFTECGLIVSVMVGKSSGTPNNQLHTYIVLQYSIV